MQGWLSKKQNVLIKEHFVPQVYFTHIDGEIGLDFLGYYESLEQDYIYLKGYIEHLPELPFINQGTVSKSSIAPETVSTLRALYRADYLAYSEQSPW